MFGNEILCEEAFFLRKNNIYSARVASDTAKIYMIRREDLEKILVNDLVVKEDFVRFCTRKLYSLARRVINLSFSGFKLFKFKVKEDNEIKKVKLRNLLKKNEKTGLIIKNEKWTKDKRQHDYLPSIETRMTTISPKNKPILTEIEATTTRTKPPIPTRKLDQNKKFFLRLLKTNDEIQKAHDSLKVLKTENDISIMDINRSSIGMVSGVSYNMRGKTVKPKKYQKIKKRVAANVTALKLPF